MVVEGTVEAVRKDRKGFKINGDWYMFSSKWGGDRPKRGDSIEMVYSEDDKGNKWVNKLKVKKETDKDRRISRLSLISSVVEMFKTHNRFITTQDLKIAVKDLEEFVYTESLDNVPDEYPDVPF